MSLGLKFMRVQHRFQVGAEEGHGSQLIAIELGSHPNEMDVVWHQTVDRREKSLANAGVQHEFAKTLMEGLGKPTF